MPFLQFLNGSRDQQFEALNEQASLVVGSGGDAHIRLGDPGVEAKHCTVYPGQGKFWLQDLGAGSTIFKMKRLANGTEGLVSGDIFILGTTFVKFWKEKPAGGGGGGGADPAALKTAQQELATAKADLARIKSEASGATQELQELQEQVRALEGQVEEAREQHQGARAELEAAQEKVEQLEGDLSRARAEAESAVAGAEEEARRGRAELEDALEATRAQLEASRAEAAARGRDALEAARAPSDLQAALEALRLPDALRRRLEAAVASEVDREVLRRVRGPVVPIRGLKIAGCERDLESELSAIRRREEQVDAARRLELEGLDPEQLERLLELARR